MHKPVRGRMLGLLERATGLPALPFRKKSRGIGKAGRSHMPIAAETPRSLVRRVAGAWLQRRQSKHPDHCRPS